MKCCGKVSRKLDTETLRNFINNPVLVLSYKLLAFSHFFQGRSKCIQVINLYIICTSTGFLNLIINGCFAAFHWQLESLKKSIIKHSMLQCVLETGLATGSVSF